MLDYYKHQGEKRILETFKSYQAHLREEEANWNRQKEAQRTRKRDQLGTITPFSFRNKVQHMQYQESVSLSRMLFSNWHINTK